MYAVKVFLSLDDINWPAGTLFLTAMIEVLISTSPLRKHLLGLSTVSTFDIILLYTCHVDEGNARRRRYKKAYT